MDIQRLAMGPIRNHYARNGSLGWQPEGWVIFTWLGVIPGVEARPLGVVEYCEDFFACEPSRI